MAVDGVVSRLGRIAIHAAWLWIGCAGLSAIAARADETPFEPAEIDFFEKRVRPILAERCYACHSDKSGKKRGGLTLDDRAALLRGGDSGPAAVVGDPAKSLLIEAVLYAPDGLQMPPTGKLPQAEIDLLTEWVKRRLPHPTNAQAQAARQAIDLQAGRRHWAFQPLVVQSLPVGIAAQAGWNRIDFFLEEKRRSHGIVASPPAAAHTLARRASFDLLGLPPADSLLESGNYEEQLSALLASPHYGERWGRHWLDLVRYADITESWREGEGQPWRYRDWVVQAFNQDLPYNEFVIKQLAADLVPNPQPPDNAALGFWGLSPSYWKELKLDHQLIKQVVAEEWEERLDALGSTFLGLSIGCARCHDHKFDPITTQDYYALAGVLASIRETDRPLIAPELAAPALAARSAVKALEAKLKPIKGKKSPTAEEKAEGEKIEAEIDRLRATPHFDLPLAPGVSDAALHVLPSGANATRLDYRPGEAQDIAVHIRGNPARTGEVAPRRFLAVLAANPEHLFRQGSGRLELAQALVQDAGPLAARVMVNRIWKHHFGRGLVETPSNFGKTGAPPSHPELLDDLAARFVAQGWSLKWLHREIMLSAAYRQASYRDPAAFAKDPDNQWLWRMPPRRLDIEAWRDSLLFASGELDLKVGGPPLELASASNMRRTVYGVVKRRELSEMLRLHDFPDPVAHSAQRDPTTTPLQQLFVLNSPFFARQASTVATRVRSAAQPTGEQITRLYQLLFQREPTAAERALGEQFIASFPAGGSADDNAWRQYVQVLLASNEFQFID